MSTRAHICIKDRETGKTSTLYHHCDGYLEGVGNLLNKFLSNTTTLSLTPEELAKSLENWDCNFEYDNCGFHGDEEFIYHIDIDNKSVSLTAEELTDWKNNSWCTCKGFEYTYEK